LPPGVDRNGNIVFPCGMCREMIADYGPNTIVVVKKNESIVGLPISELIPLKYTRS
jgi:cytidine deaminase